MSNPNKEKGTRWEREAAHVLNEEFPETWRRIALSGAIGTIQGIPELAADLQGVYPFLDKTIMAEAKVGYGGKSMTIQKAWFDGIATVAKGVYGIPVVLLKFEKSRSGVKHVLCMDFEVWNYLMNFIKDLQKENEELLNKVFDGK